MRYNLHMKLFSLSSWIWAINSCDIDDYASFIANFDCPNNHAVINISSDSVYAIYLNNKLIKFMGCSDYPYYKFYDSIELNCKNKDNCLRIDVWHIGIETQNYFKSEHGLIFEIISENKVLAASNKNTQSRVISQFENGYKKLITKQLGFSFKYDANKQDNSYQDSIIINKQVGCFHKREINSIDLFERGPIKITKLEDSFLIDLGHEVVGIPDLDFVSNSNQNILISFGEHIIDGGVRRCISDRDFSFEYVAKKGINQFLNPLRRIAGRYLQVYSNQDIEINYIGIRPVKYNHKLINKDIKDLELRKIYSVCVNTLECCMHEHYEDCPWREQALYTLDSRNQMLCGYFAFEGFEYQKHNLLLINQGSNENGLLSLCFPMNGQRSAIPMFSLFYIIQVYEYVEYTKDFEILPLVKDTIYKIVECFKNRIDVNNLIPNFEKPCWNFYEWTDGSSGQDLSSNNEKQYDLILNAMYAYVIPLFNELYGETIDTSLLIQSINGNFYDAKTHLFKINNLTEKSSRFGNSLAILIGLGDQTTLNKIANCEGMIDASLSTFGFVYDALLIKDTRNKEFVLNDIKNKYLKMISEGATTVYETEKGADDFGGAGSLCHGWSALPIYYLNILGKN